MLAAPSRHRIQVAIASRLRKARARLFPAPPEDNIPDAVPEPLIEYIAADIVNNCNLRCPFCLVDYDQVKTTNLMTEETFRALIRLAPAVREGGFWLSCLHEPTLHPRLGDFINLIPEDQRKKFWFTTNLTRPLPEALIETIATAGLHHINVSLDSLNDELFAMLRKHGRLKVFRENLDRVVEAFARTEKPPFIRYITMAYRSNMAEIPDMVRWVNEQGLAYEIEIRYTFNTANISEDFRREQFLRPEEWLALKTSLEAQPYSNYILGMPPDNYDTEQPYLPANWFENVPVTPPPHKGFARPLQLRARPDGRLHLSGAEHVFAVKVGDLEDPIAFLKDITSEQPPAVAATPALAAASS